MATQSTALLLQKQLKQLSKEPVVGFSARLADESNIFAWDVTVSGPPHSPYSGGLFKATMTFPSDYPLNPPKVKFTSDMWHPNVFSSGDLCISILNPPAAYDPPDAELYCDCWSRNHTVESIFLCIISILSCPNCESPANPYAAGLWVDNRKAFIEKVKKCVLKSLVQSL